MRTPPLNAATAIACFLVLSQSSLAQSCPSHPTDSVATIDTAIAASIILPPRDSSRFDFDFLSSTEDGDHLRAELCVYRTASGGTDLIVAPATIESDPHGIHIDDYTTVEIFDSIAVAAVREALSLGLIALDSVGEAQSNVWTPSCVTRSGSGSTTAFALGVPGGLAYRTYAIDCQSAGCAIAETSSSSGASCNAGSVSTSH